MKYTGRDPARTTTIMDTFTENRMLIMYVLWLEEDRDQAHKAGNEEMRSFLLDFFDEVPSDYETVANEMGALGAVFWHGDDIA